VLQQLAECTTALATATVEATSMCLQLHGSWGQSCSNWPAEAPFCDREASEAGELDRGNLSVASERCMFES
jgi:hypothetical protein